ncbi:hypothetical protein C4J98_2993 [Pseudomonas orientalis]|nr:hypothetical protein C4J98_2993 [Pseudomonas orientalis]
MSGALECPPIGSNRSGPSFLSCPDCGISYYGIPSFAQALCHTGYPLTLGFTVR